MAITIDPATKVINVPKADLTLIQSSPTEIRQLDLNWFRLILKDLEDDEEGIWMDTTHTHQQPVSVGGVLLARVVQLINDYTVTFEDGQYAVNLVGANSNVADKVNVNQVSVRAANSAGLVETQVSGLTNSESTMLSNADAQLGNLRKLMQNRMETNPTTGLMTIYDDDDTTVLFSGNIYEDVAASTLYRGRGIERRNRLS